jgi:diguanylate cyclase (GGDEF)-like protein
MHIIDVGNRESVRNPILLAMEHNKNVNIADNCALIRRDGTEFAIEDSAAPIHDHRGHVTGAVMVFRDVSAARAIALKMAYLAQHDVLTGLPNRVLLNDRMTQAMASARRHDQQLALLFVDIDRFKHVNDSFGHSIGDQLLKAVAQRLLTCVRSTDTVCRFGGDEFVVLLSEISYPADGIVCADKIANELNMPYDIGEHRLHLTASIGISIYPNDGIDAETLLKNADSAMFRAKSNGRNNYQLFKPLDTLPTIDWQPRESDWRCATEQAEHKS